MTRLEDTPDAQGPLRRVLGNFGLLLRGRGIAAVMLLGATALTARALGPAEFGMLVLMQTYVLLIRGLLNFKQFQAIIRYGVPAHDAGEIRTLVRLIAVSRRLDRRSILVATALALGLAPVAGPLMGMDRGQVILLASYSLVLLSAGNMTAIGLLRLYDQFGTLGMMETIAPTIRFFGVLLAWWLDAPFGAYIAILGVAYVAENLYLSFCGRREYRRHIVSASADEKVSNVTMEEFAGLRQFVWVTYWQSNMDLIPKHISVIVAGHLLGATDAGLLRLARQFSSMLAKPATLIRQVVFPDLTRSWNEGSTDFKLVAYRIALFGGLVGLLFVLIGYFFGELLLGALLGNEFVAAAPVLTLLLLAATFELTASSLRSAAYAIGHASKVLRLSVLSAAIYFVLLTVLTAQMGLVGAGVASCIAALLPPVVMAVMIHRSVHSRAAAPGQGGG